MGISGPKAPTTQPTCIAMLYTTELLRQSLLDICGPREGRSLLTARALQTAQAAPEAWCGKNPCTVVRCLRASCPCTAVPGHTLPRPWGRHLRDEERTQVSFVVLLRLHEGHQLRLVLAGEGGSIKDGRQCLDSVGHVLGVHLCKRGRVLGHLLGQDPDCAAKNVDGVDELGIAGREIGCLFVADGGGILPCPSRLRLPDPRATASAPRNALARHGRRSRRHSSGTCTNPWSWCRAHPVPHSGNARAYTYSLFEFLNFWS